MSFRPQQAERALAALGSFYTAPIARVLERHLVQSADALVVDHFHSVVASVPAYRSFLDKHGVSPGTVTSIADFKRLPLTTKANYQRTFALSELCREGALDAADALAVSSGSTGTPAIWPRFVTDELGTAARFEQVLHDGFGAERRRTLAVVAFALGNWVGGMYTTACLRHLAAKGYALTIATPGNNKAEILRVLAPAREHFDEVVLFGYPPFLKDLIDGAIAEGFDWSRRPTRLVMAGEVFSEEWRQLVCERLGQDDPAHATASLYGTADGGVLGNETPLSVRIRQFLASRPGAARELFGESRLPTLCQYDPIHRYFEVDSGELIFSGDAAAPLVRYNIHDRGGVIGHAAMRAVLADHGFDPLAGLSPDERERVRALPFVFVFGRSHFALSFYGANVFPENVSIGIEQREFAGQLSGKFVMQVVRDADLDAALEIVVELLPGASGDADLAARLSESIREHLERVNSEFANYAPRERRTPRVRFAPHADPEYFPPGVKHRYTRE